MLRKKLPDLKLFDIIASVVALAIIGATVVLAVASSSDGTPRVYIRSSKGEFIYQLNANETVVLDGPIGQTIVEIAGGGVRVVEDPGPRQICVNQGWIQRPGQWLACLPNRVFISIERDRTTSIIDAVSY